MTSCDGYILTLCCLITVLVYCRHNSLISLDMLL